MNRLMKRNLGDFILPTLMLTLSAGLVFGTFSWIKSWNTALIQQVAIVAGEETSPTAGRLIACGLYFVLSVFLTALAERLWQGRKDRLLLPWTLAALGGTMLWTCVGEASWHFGLAVLNDEGEVFFANLPRIESIQGIPVFILLALLYAAIRRAASFPLRACLLAFLGNWYGHLCMIGAYPIARALGSAMDMPSWYKLSAVVNALVLGAVGIALMRGRTERQAKYLAAVCEYVALGAILFGVILGET